MAGKATVGDYVTLQRGITYKGNLVGKAGPALLGLGSIHPGGGFREGDYKTYGGDCPPKLMLYPGDLFVSLKGATKDGKMIGSVARVPPSVPSGRLTQDTVKLEFRDQNPETANFLYWILRTPQYRDYCDGRATGSAVVALSRDDFLDYPVPSITKTRLSIVKLLEELDDKIELNRRTNATLEAMARALFQSWFVDFDPVRTKLDGRHPAALDPATAALFPEHFAHGEHDRLPVGWRHAAIEEVCAINAWTLGKNDDLETLEYVEISEVSRGNIANIATYSRGEEPSRARRRLRHGDTVLSTVRPDRGSYFLALHPPENRVVSTGFAVLTPTKVPWSFVHAALTQPEVSDHLRQMADGGAYPAVRPEVIGTMQVALPNELKIPEAFHRLCAPLFEQAEANRTQSRTLATLRDTLLPKLLSGELSVEGIEPRLEAAS
jgi:type I restriction enzyme S subunit